MGDRYLALWFRHLTTDWLTLKRPAHQNKPLVFSAAERGRKIVTAANALAQGQGITIGMVIADARMLVPEIEIIEDRPELAGKLLEGLAVWCLSYTPMVAVDPPEGLILDVSGCAHLWGGERAYFKEIIVKLRAAGYSVRGAMADTIGAAWAWARFGSVTPILEKGEHSTKLLPLSPASLRLEAGTLARLQKIGFRTIDTILRQPRGSLLPRFGKELPLRLDQAFGKEVESLVPIQPAELYQERLPCLEPIRTAGGIEIALTRLLELLCRRLQGEGKGLRMAVFKCYRVDGKLEQISIGTSRATYNINHLFKLFGEKIPTIEPDLGIEVFQLEAPKIEDASSSQETLWGGPCGIEGMGLAELLDRLANKTGDQVIHRYLPDQHYWPERSIKRAPSLVDKPLGGWPDDRPRPFHLLGRPERIEVTAPIPDYPPMNFRYKGKLHKIRRADGPERIENEWWLEEVRHRDYYAVEDEEGARYWLFRSGHYDESRNVQWFLHGFFA